MYVELNTKRIKLTWQDVIKVGLVGVALLGYVIRVELALATTREELLICNAHLSQLASQINHKSRPLPAVHKTKFANVMPGGNNGGPTSGPPPTENR